MKKVVSLLLTLLIAFSFASCSSGGGSGSKKEKNEVKGVIETALEAVKKCDVKKVNKTVQSENLKNLTAIISENKDLQKIVKSVFEPLKYDVKDVCVSEDKASATVEFKTKDLKSVFVQYSKELISQRLQNADSINFEDKKFVGKQVERINALAKEAGDKKFNVTVNLEKVDGDWVIISDDMLEDAVMGGAASVIESMVTLFNQM